ncbi:MAG: T9SS type A sorting domain-containing protein [Ignavibacteria bacterium]
MKRLLKVLYFVLLTSIFSEVNSQTVSFYQDNLIFSDVFLNPDTTVNSYLGKAKLTFTSSDTIKYFNLTISGNGITDCWIIMNYPVTSLQSSGSTESKHFPIVISDTNSSGINVTTLNYGFSFTDDSITTAPVASIGTVATDFVSLIYNGFIDNRPVFPERRLSEVSDASENIYSSVVLLSGKTRPGFTIQECEKGESFPSSLSDGAKYLQELVPIISPDLISIDSMKSYSLWGAKGVYLYNTGYGFDYYIRNSFTSNVIPIIISSLYSPPTSAEIDNILIPRLNQFATNDFYAIFFLIKFKWRNPISGVVIETNHVINIRSITKIRSELYAISYSYDSWQGTNGGTIIEEGLYSSLTNKFIWFYGCDINSFPLSGTDVGNYYIDKTDYVLPVELTSFTSTVNTRNVILNWTTTYEKNNSGFEIQRTESESNDWRTFGFVSGMNNSKLTHEYKFMDKNLNTGKYLYRLKQIDYNGNFEYFRLENEVVIGIPDKFSIQQNFPNPFNPNTKINYELPESGIASIKIYDINGKEIKMLFEEFKTAGYYSIDFNAGDIPSGTYFYKLDLNGNSVSGKMVLLK